MPVYVVRKINMTLNEDRGLFRKTENIKFIFTLEFSRRNLASRQNQTILKECNLAMYYR